MPGETDSAPAPDSWRAALTETYDKLASGPDPSAAVDQPGTGTPAETPAAAAGADSDTSGAAPDSRARDATGKFVKQETKPAAKDAPPPPSAKPLDAGQGAAAGATPPGAAPVAPPITLRAPQSWKPAVRELVSKLPAEFHPIIEESLRRDKETSAALQQAAERERGAGEFQQAISPYEHLLRATGAPPAQAVGNILQQYAALASGPPHVKLAVAADIIRNFIGTDEASLGKLAEFLVTGGQRAAPQAVSPQQIQQLVQQQLAQERQRSVNEQAAAVIREFEAGEPEYLKNVEQELVALVSIENQRNPGKQWTVERLKELHQRALRLNPETADVMKQREAAKSAETSQEATRRAQAASSSIKGSPGGAGNGTAPADDSWGSHLRAVAAAKGW